LSIKEAHLLNREAVLQIFQQNKPTDSYLDFETKDEVSQSQSIRKREMATSKSFHAESLDKTAQLQGSATYPVIQSMLQTVLKSKLLPEINGIVVELGSGIGLLGIALVSQDHDKDISGVLAVEAGLPFVEKGIRLAANELLEESANRIAPCYGTFDDLKIEDSTVDFIIQIEALHHADDLDSALAESFRILRSGGYLISIDRSWPDSTHRNVLEELLNHEYPKEWLETKGFPTHETFTRRDNGEHEYLDSDWKKAFLKAGFDITSFNVLHPKITFWHLRKRIVCFFRLEKLLGIKISSRNGIIRGFLTTHKPYLANKVRGVIVTDHPRSLTLQVYKKN